MSARRSIPPAPWRPLARIIVLLLVAGAACGKPYMSAGVGVSVPAPWGSVTVGTTVPVGYPW